MGTEMPPWGGGDRNQMVQQAGKGTEESNKTTCTYSPAFWTKLPMTGLSNDPHLPTPQLRLPGPCSFWLVPLGKAVIFPFEQGQVWSLGPGQEGGQSA